MWWMSIEVRHGEPSETSHRAPSAYRWRDSYDDQLVGVAISHGALDWAWHSRPWGVVFEVCFADEAEWAAFRALPAVRAALDAVPDPVAGLAVYRGRGGSAGRSIRPRPCPRRGAGAAAVPLPEPPPERLADRSSVATLAR